MFRRWAFAYYGIAVLLALAFYVTLAKPASADHDGDFLPALPTWAMQRIEHRGYGLYKLDWRTSAWSGFREQLWKMYGQECDVSRICWYEASPEEDADLIWAMPDSWTYGGGGIVGVAWYTNAPARIDINFRAGIIVWGSVTTHEQGHIDGEADWYWHRSDGSLSCRWLDFSRMSCGTGIGIMLAVDRDVVWNVFVPDLPSASSVARDGNQLIISYSNTRASAVGCAPYSILEIMGGSPTQRDNWCGHYSTKLDNVTRVALFYQDADFGWAFIGYAMPPSQTWNFGYAVLDYGSWCPAPYRRFGVHPESNLAITWPTWAGGVGFFSGDIAEAGGCP